MIEHEIRVALVMNGGVSLAVWMGGVTHELDLIRRATAGPGAPKSQAYDRALAERWRGLLQPEEDEESRRLVVDVVAGTSAGGLNGAMLATAVAHGTTLDPGEPGPSESRGPWLRKQWSELGALEVDKLIPNSVTAERDNTKTYSVLDGQYFLRQTKRLMGELAEGAAADLRDPVTLFTTASGLGTQSFTATDAAGQEFDVADHRFLYRFTTDKPWVYKGDGRTFAAPDTDSSEFADTDTIALASRASASFPVAFAPVSEGDRLNKVRPPRERPRRQGSEASWLMDGGVLDNAPFGPVLDTVARMAVSGHATRYVLYVVPSSGIGKGTTQVTARVVSPGGYDAAPADTEPDRTTPGWRTAAASAIQYPREVDFRGDVEELERLLLEADAGWSDTQRMFELACVDENERGRVVAAARLLQPTYVRGRAAGGVWEAITVAQSNQSVLDADAIQREDDVAQILAVSPAWTPNVLDPFRPTVPGPDGTTAWPWGVGPAERVVRLILRHLRSRLAATLEPRRQDAQYRADSVVQVEQLETSLRTVSLALRHVLAVRQALTPAIKAADFSAQTSAVAVARGLNAIFADLQVQAALGAQIRDVRAALSGEADLVETATAVEVVSRCTSARTPDQRSAPFKFVRLGPDIHLPLLDDEIADPRHRDPVGPEDRSRARETVEELGDRILYGTQVGHFGAFGAEGWRRWDWMLGRLHAVAHLGYLLNPPQTAREWVRETQLAVLSAEGWTMRRFVDQLETLRRDFPLGAGTKAVGAMVDALNAADASEPATDAAATVIGIGDRLVHFSNGLPSVGRWVHAAAGRREHPSGWPLRAVRWFTQPAREALWNRLTNRRAQLDTVGAPFPLSIWLSYPLVALGVVLVVLAALVSGRPGISIVFAVAAGVLLAAGGALVVGGVLLHRLRRLLGDRVESELDERLGTGPRA